MEKATITLNYSLKEQNFKEPFLRFSMEIKDEPGLDELLEKFKGFCLAIGYHPKCVNFIQYLERNGDEKEMPECPCDCYKCRKEE